MSPEAPPLWPPAAARINYIILFRDFLPHQYSSGPITCKRSLSHPQHQIAVSCQLHARKLLVPVRWPLLADIIEIAFIWIRTLVRGRLRTYRLALRQANFSWKWVSVRARQMHVRFSTRYTEKFREDPRRVVRTQKRTCTCRKYAHPGVCTLQAMKVNSSVKNTSCSFNNKL